jgi:D-alanyl-D-alanine carboxypeptidase-like protein
VRRDGGNGQASVLLVGGLAGLVIAAVIAGAVARAVGREAGAQRAADLAAVAAGNAMHVSYGRLFEPVTIRRQPNPRHLEKDEYLALGRAAAEQVARANGAPAAEVTFPDGETIAPVRVRVTVRETVRVGRARAGRLEVHAEAELGPGDLTGFAAGGGYDGPLAYRQGKPMRPDVALAFDRLEAAARAEGVTLLITSGYRSDAEQAVLWARHPDPKWVARPGTSLHRFGTELDLGPPAAYGWLAAHANAFHFIQRYAWEPWHYGCR